MSEQQHSDPLEEFFREKAQNYDIEYNEEDWHKLEKRLDEAERNQPVSQWRRYLVAAIIAFLFSILAYITYQQQLTINELNKRLTSSEQTNNTQDQPWIVLQQELLALDFIDDLSNPTAFQTSDNEKNTNTVNESSGERKSKPLTDIKETTDIQQQKDKTTYSEQHNVALTELSQQDVLLASPNEKDLDNFSIPTMPATNTPTSVDDLTDTQSGSPFTLSTIAQSNQPVTKKSPFSAALMAGPDLSTVGGIADFYDPGYKMGLALEYSLSENLSLSIGAVHSKVQYSARGNDYSPPQGYWGYGATPDKTIAQCFIIDIPISITYDFLHFDHSRLYASTGLSSYIMLNEDYQFRYNTYAAGQPQRWQERTGTKHWMSNATFSLGYEIDLKPKISFRLEPFIKVPMRDVGWGQVKLYSMGSLASISYDF